MGNIAGILFVLFCFETYSSVLTSTILSRAQWCWFKGKLLPKIVRSLRQNFPLFYGALAGDTSEYLIQCGIYTRKWSIIDNVICSMTTVERMVAASQQTSDQRHWSAILTAGDAQLMMLRCIEASSDCVQEAYRGRVGNSIRPVRPARSPARKAGSMTSLIADYALTSKSISIIASQRPSISESTRQLKRLVLQHRQQILQQK